jgi:uncharacterized damage-inducible protein DinB
MSTTATATDLKGFLAEAIEQSAETLIKDISYIPEDKMDQSPMGCARSPLDFLVECAGFTGLVTKAVLKEDSSMPSEDEIKQFQAMFNTREKAVGLLKTNTDQLVAAVRNMDEAELSREVPTYWGSVIPLSKMLYIVASHNAYHDGQVNYIQCLYGDGAMHWAE